MPDNFIYAYNEVLEIMGKDPKIYIPHWDMHMDKPYYREGRTLTFEGVFPCNDEGEPVMKWIGLKIINGGKVHKCTCSKAKSTYLSVDVNPNSIIYYWDEIDGEGFWNQVYAGPQTMKFNYEILKEKRKALGYTQEDVAYAVGTRVRTYQKWEYGQTSPNGYFLLRLMNWLDIENVQDMIEFDVID